MRLEAVNRSMPRAVTLLGREVVTGIDKQPTEGPVPVSAEGLDGDGVGDAKDHGGPDQAIYLYGGADYDWWVAEEGMAVHPGFFGENLTVSSVTSAALEVGDHFEIGPVQLEVTAPRIPCATLSGRVGDADFARRFAAARRPGAYLRVLAGGTIARGELVEHRPGHSGVTLAACMGAYYDTETPDAEVDRLLATPIASRFRTLLERRRTRGTPP